MMSAVLTLIALGGVGPLGSGDVKACMSSASAVSFFRSAFQPESKPAVFGESVWVGLVNTCEMAVVLTREPNVRLTTETLDGSRQNNPSQPILGAKAPVLILPGQTRFVLVNGIVPLAQVRELHVSLRIELIDGSQVVAEKTFSRAELASAPRL